MFRRYIVLTSIVLALIILFILIYGQNQVGEDPKVYQFAVETSDLRIADIEFVTYSHSLYITDHHLEIIGDNKQFSGVSYGISIGGKMILSVSQADDPFTLPDSFQGQLNYNTRNLLQDIKVKGHDKVGIEIRYEVNGVTKHLTGSVPLSKIIKSSSDNKNVIRLEEV